MDDATLTTLRVIASAVVDAGFAGCVGALVTAAMLADVRSAWADRRRRRTVVVLRASALVALAGSLAWMWEQAISMTELPPLGALGAAWPVVTDTGFGRLWALQALVLFAFAAWSFTPHARVRRGLLSLPTLVVPALFAGLRASAGHAGVGVAAQGVPVAGLVMAMHLLAMATWAGAVLAGAAAVMPGDAADDATPDPSATAERLVYVERLSRTATVALSVVLLTGVASAWRVLGALPAPAAALAWDAPSNWGPTLVGKLVLVASAMALGAWNRFATLPALRAGKSTLRGGIAPAWRRFARMLQVEAVVLVGVIAAAAMLANGEPPTP